MSNLRLATLSLAALLLLVLLARQFRRRTALRLWVLAGMLLVSSIGLAWLGIKLTVVC